MTNQFQLTPEITHMIAVWALGGDTGVSSETIAAVALGMKSREVGSFGFNTPSDNGDFGRCYRLLKKIPELRAALPLVAEACPKWKPLVAEWDNLTALYEADEEAYERKDNSYKATCYARLNELRDACLEAAGFVKTGQNSWERKGASEVSIGGLTIRSGAADADSEGGSHD